MVTYKIEVNNLDGNCNIFLDDKDQYFLEVDIYFLIALDQWIDRSSQNVVGGGRQEFPLGVTTYKYLMFSHKRKRKILTSLRLCSTIKRGKRHEGSLFLLLMVQF